MNSRNVQFTFTTLVVIDDRDGNYEISPPVLLDTKEKAIDLAAENFKRFIGSEWGKVFKKQYPKTKTANDLKKFLAEDGIFVLFDDSGNFRRIYKIDGAEMIVSLWVS